MHLPAKKTSRSKYGNVDWNKRDEEILLKVKNLVDNLIDTRERPKRINLNRIGKTLNIYYILSKYIEKLPKTAIYLNDVIETNEEYINRKIRWAINEINEKDEFFNVESVIYLAGIYGKDKIKYRNSIENEINNYLKKYEKVLVDE